MFYRKPVTDIIKQRFSCRTYLDTPIAEEKRQRLAEFISSIKLGPLGAPMRFALIAATEQDRNSLRGLGTYGFIKGATGFIVGAVGPFEKNLEDYGYGMERAILFATDLELGTCWLGGSFTQSSFAKKIAAKDGELVPAVTSIGYISDKSRSEDWIRQYARSDSRQPRGNLFFQKRFRVPLLPEQADAYAVPLEMVRLGPSASNKQPWRIIQDGNAWHFYLQRTKGYGDGLAFKLLRLADLQRVDMGIAMSHFQLTASELGLSGQWVIQEPEIEKPDRLTAYTVSWMEKQT
jgi:Putative TM nitroreductase